MEIDIQKEIIAQTEIFVRNYFSDNTDGHDWWHTNRVRNIALNIAKKEKAENPFLIELIALLHDIDDYKITGNSTLEKTKAWLNNFAFDKEEINTICNSIKAISYKGAHVIETEFPIEGKIVQDADRIDALGAIGIARAFAYGGSKKRPIYIPDEKPILHKNENEYRNSKGHTINHFYEKLLLLKERLNTNSAKEMAEDRHKIMEQFLEQFYKEWNVEINS